MALEVRNTRDLTVPYLATIVYGPPKSGKTTFCTTLGEAPLVVDFDDGLLTLKDLGVNYVQPRTWEEVLELVSALRSGKLRERVEYDHVIWDSHTMFYNTILIPSVLKLSGRTTLTQPEWGMCNDRAKLIYDQLIKSRTAQRFHFSLTCHEKIDKDEVTGMIVGGISATPALRELLPAMVDEFYYIKPHITGSGVNKTGTYKVHTLTEGMFPAGTRTKGKLSPVEDADLGAIYRKITSAAGAKGGK